MRVLAFSDLHLDRLLLDQILAEAERADLVIGAGDFAQRREGLKPFMDLFEPIAEKSVFVPGNNESSDELRRATRAQVLHGQELERGGVRIVGIGAAIPPLPPTDWNSFDISEQDAESILAQFDGMDVLVTHSPPFGVVDRHASLGSIGSQSVLAAIKRMKPELVLCGHVHDCWGMEGTIGRSQVFNLGPKPVWFDL